MIAENFLFYFFSSLALASGIMVIRSKNPVHSVLFLILVFCNAAGLLILLDLDFFAMIFLVVYVGAIAVLFLFVVMMLHIKLTEMNENILRYLPVGGIIGIIFLIEVLLVVENDFIPLLSFHEESFLAYVDYFMYKIKWVFYSLFGLIPMDIVKQGQTANSSMNSQYTAFTNDLNSLFSSYDHTSIEALKAFQSFQYTQWNFQIENITKIEALGQILYTYYFYFFIMASLILLIAMIGAIVLTGTNTDSTVSQVKRQEISEQNSREFSKTIRKIRIQN